MTDIAEQAARKVFEHQIPLASDKPRDFDDPKFLYERNKAFDTAQALADAGLLREPEHAVPPGKDVAALITNARAICAEYDFDLLAEESWPTVMRQLIDALEAPQADRRDVYVIAAQRIGTGETWTVDAREALGMQRTEPTRGQIAEAIRGAIDNPREASWDMDLDAADAVLALLADQPTDAEVKAQAWDEAATHLAGEYDDHNAAQYLHDTNPYR